jgi:hypothetical protein
MAGLEAHRATALKMASDPAPVLSRSVRPAPAQEQSVTGAADLTVRVVGDKSTNTRVGLKTSGGCSRPLSRNRFGI